METGPEVGSGWPPCPRAEFEAAMNERGPAASYGPLTLDAPAVTVWPIISQKAERGWRRARGADGRGGACRAAHRRAGAEHVAGRPALLLDLAVARADSGLGRDAGGLCPPPPLEVEARLAGIDLLNRASMMGAQGLRNLRAGALDALYALARCARP
jgi:2-octaprenyl-6-methoxyphenol hydroxylase